MHDAPFNDRKISLHLAIGDVFAVFTFFPFPTEGEVIEKGIAE